MLALPLAPATAKVGGGFGEVSAPKEDKGGAKAGKNEKSDKSGKDEKVAKGGKAKLDKNGDAIAPAGAPKDVLAVIKAANKINDKPYVYGGGHKKFDSKGYDCSGAVSYALRGAKLIKSPITSGDFARYGKGGKGDWMTIYANGGHVSMTVAGLRWDTSGDKGEDGPRWHEDKRSANGFKVRHPRGL